MVDECHNCHHVMTCEPTHSPVICLAFYHKEEQKGLSYKAIKKQLPQDDKMYLQNFTESDGSTASYYELPDGCSELQDLISYRNMNAQLGEIFRAVYRYGLVKHSPKERDIKKIIFYAQKELERLEKYGDGE